MKYGNTIEYDWKGAHITLQWSSGRQMNRNKNEKVEVGTL